VKLLIEKTRGFRMPEVEQQRAAISSIVSENVLTCFSGKKGQAGWQGATKRTDPGKIRKDMKKKVVSKNKTTKESGIDLALEKEKC